VQTGIARRREFGIRLSDGELRQLVTLFPAASSPSEVVIPYEKFVEALSGGEGFNTSRREVVAEAYRALQSGGGVPGGVELTFVRENYDCEAHPHVRSGKRTAYQILREFAAAVDPEGEGVVSGSSFASYYEGVSQLLNRYTSPLPYPPNNHPHFALCLVHGADCRAVRLPSDTSGTATPPSRT
jgi:hypothetical protein